MHRSTFYHQRCSADGSFRELAKRGPKTLYTDEELTGHIRAVITTSPFLRDVHRKIWARLRVQGIRTSKPHVLPFMRQAGLLVPSRASCVLGS